MVFEGSITSLTHTMFNGVGILTMVFEDQFSQTYTGQVLDGKCTGQGIMRADSVTAVGNFKLFDIDGFGQV